MTNLGPLKCIFGPRECGIIFQRRFGHYNEMIAATLGFCICTKKWSETNWFARCIYSSHSSLYNARARNGIDMPPQNIYTSILHDAEHIG
jgi:hypothetical protein